MSAALQPKAGFDWTRVTWGRPDSPPTVLCSYCSAALPEGDDAPIPLMLFTGDGHAARFCPRCGEACLKASLDYYGSKEKR
jgi:hypothetical protein